MVFSETLHVCVLTRISLRLAPPYSSSLKDVVRCTMLPLALAWLSMAMTRRISLSRRGDLRAMMQLVCTKSNLVLTALLQVL
jgi:hypothetical protein